MNDITNSRFAVGIDLGGAIIADGKLYGGSIPM